MNIAQAENTTTPPPSAISIAKQIEENALVRISNQDSYIEPETFLAALTQVIETLSSEDKEGFDRALDVLRLKANQEDIEYATSLISLFAQYADHHDFSGPTGSKENVKEFLESIPDSEHWFVRLHAMRLLSIVHTFMNQKGVALQIAEDALNVIPNEITAETTNARIAATELIAYLQNLHRNKELALLNTQRLIDLKVEAGYPIDGVELLNNLMYVYGAWRENDTRLELAQTLVRLERKHGSSTPGLSNLQVAITYVDIGEYEKAIEPAKEAARDAQLENIKYMAKLILASAYAGLGDISAANETLKIVPEALKDSSRGKYAQTLIALKEGRVDEALSLMNARFDQEIQRFLTETSNNTTQILASLENSSERQAEREASLRREAAFIQSRLDQQERFNKLLILLTCLTIGTGFGIFLFARKQHKLSKLLAIKSAEAESADRMKTEFLGMVSHELRTPLNGIIGVADVLAEMGPSEEIRERGKIILSSGNMLFSLIESIIDMSRIDGGKLELITQPASLKDVLTDCVQKWEDIAQAKGLIFTSHIPEICAEDIHIDPPRLGQCVDTLLSNAIKFTDNGRVHFHVTAQDEASKSHRKFEIIVADTGQGMSETVQERLFTPFLQADSSMTRKHGGSGLRLAIARGTARLMDGDITVNSREGRGSEFKFVFPAKISMAKLSESLTPSKKTKRPSLPPAIEKEEENNDQALAIADIVPRDIAEASQSNSQSNEIQTIVNSSNFSLEHFETENDPLPPPSPVGNFNDIDLSNCRVLIVEDTPSSQDVVEFLLRQAGIDCVSVDSTEEALNSLNTAYFDIVISDVHMKGDEGLRTTHQIRKSGKDWSEIPIIALTADNTSEVNAACMAAGVNAFLTKPVLSKDLLRNIRFLQAQKRGAMADKVAITRRKAW
jgi:signal transduction histidine kinase/CheY-like chemotaxis protein